MYSFKLRSEQEIAAIDSGHSYSTLGSLKTSTLNAIQHGCLWFPLPASRGLSNDSLEAQALPLVAQLAQCSMGKWHLQLLMGPSW